jgi:hypothetical protein
VIAPSGDVSRRIPEEDEKIDAAFGDAGADLLIAAERAAAEAGDRERSAGRRALAGRWSCRCSRSFRQRETRAARRAARMRRISAVSSSL